MEIKRKEVFRDSEKDYDPVEEEISIHTFSGGKFDIPIKMPSYQVEFEYEFRLVDLPFGAEDLTNRSLLWLSDKWLRKICYQSR